jgi:hypothetical protein
MRLVSLSAERVVPKWSQSPAKAGTAQDLSGVDRIPTSWWSDMVVRSRGDPLGRDRFDPKVPYASTGYNVRHERRWRGWLLELLS